MSEITETTQETTPEYKADTTTAEKQESKTFTQEEVEALIGKRLHTPEAAEIKAYREWKKAQQTEADKQKERDAEYTKLQADTETLRKENIAYKQGVNAEDVDYVVYKVGKMDGKFEENLKSYLEENKKYTEPKTTTVEGTKHQPSKSENMDDKMVAAAMKSAGLT